MRVSKNLHAAERTLAGTEVMAMIKKGQMKVRAGDKRSFAEQLVLRPRRVG